MDFTPSNLILLLQISSKIDMLDHRVMFCLVPRTEPYVHRFILDWTRASRSQSPRDIEHSLYRCCILRRIKQPNDAIQNQASRSSPFSRGRGAASASTLPLPGDPEPRLPHPVTRAFLRFFSPGDPEPELLVVGLPRHSLLRWLIYPGLPSVPPSRCLLTWCDAWFGLN